MKLFFKSLTLVLVALLSINFAKAQTKELTLEDAVMQQYRNFYPQSLVMFQWIPNTDCYSYLDGYQKLMKASVKNTTAKEILNIKQLNEKLGTELSWFSGMTWKDENTFWVNDGVKYYEYNLVEEAGKKINTLAEGAENALFNEKTKHIAFTINNNVRIKSSNGIQLSVTNNSDKNIVSGQAIARSEFGITGGLFWSNTGTSLAFYQKDETNVADYPLLDNSKTPGELMSIKYPMAGQKSEKARVGIYSVASDKTVYFEAQNGEENYLTNLSWSFDDKYIIVAEVNRDQNHMWLNVFDAKTGNFVKTLFEEKNDKWMEPEHPARFISSSNDFVWISEKNGFNNIYFYDFDGKLLKQLTDHKFVVKDIVDVKKGIVYYSTTGESPLDTKLFAVDLKGKTSVITKDAGVHSVSISTDGHFFHDHYSSHSIPSKDVVLSSKGKVLATLLEGENKLKDYKIGTTEIGTIKAKDGSTLYTRLIKPSDFDPAKKYPVLVYVYGGPHAQLITNSWYDGASLWMQWMAEQGYLLYTVDNRGSGERGFAFESQIHRQLGTVEMEDQLSGVEYLKSLPYVDGNRLAVHGWSFGGFMTTSLMLRHAGCFSSWSGWWSCYGLEVL